MLGGGGGNVEKIVCFALLMFGGLGACPSWKILKFRPPGITSGAFSSLFIVLC